MTAITERGGRCGAASWQREGQVYAGRVLLYIVFFSSRRRHTRCLSDWSSDVCSSDLVNHKDYMFDHIAWGVDVMQRVNSPRVKILYDIYHAQIMDGDIV